MAKTGWLLRPAAHADLTNIWQYGASMWGPDQADRYASELFAVFDLLAEFPEMASLREMFRPSVPIHSTRAYLVIYQEAVQGVEIIHVLHAAQKLATFIAEP